MLKKLLALVGNFVKNKEPVAVLSTVSAAVTAFVVEAQGDLTGKDAWFGVGWAVVTFLARQSVTPAGKVVVDSSGDEAKAALDWLEETAAQWAPDFDVEKFSYNNPVEDEEV